MCICIVIVFSHLQVLWDGELKGIVDSLKVWSCIDMNCMQGNEGKSGCILCYLVLILIV
jgi:hypothetical protein